MLEITEIQRHLNIDKKLLLKHCPHLKNISINEVITCLDYKDSNTNEQYRFNNFEPFDGILQQKIDTLFYMVFLTAQHEYKDSFLFGMADIMPKEDFNDNEKYLLESRIFFLKHAKEFYVGLYKLIVWRGGKRLKLQLLSTNKGKVYNDLYINVYSNAKNQQLQDAIMTIMDHGIKEFIHPYLANPFVNQKFASQLIEEISLYGLKNAIIETERDIKQLKKLLEKRKEQAKQRNIDKKSKNKKTTKQFNIYRGESSNRIFQGYIYDFVLKFCNKEGIRIIKEIDGTKNQRFPKLLTYELLCRFGLIDIDMMNKQKSIASKESHISTLPRWQE